MYKLVHTLLFILFINQLGFSQIDPKTESLYSQYKTVKSDTAKLRLSTLIAKEMLMKDRALAISIARHGVELSKTVGTKKQKAMAIYNFGYLLRYAGKGDSSILMLKKALNQFTNLQDTQNMAYAHTQLGANYYIAGNKLDALRAFNVSSEYFALARDTPGLTKSLGILSTMQSSSNLYARALETSLKALELAKLSKDSSAIAKQIANVGNVYFKLGNYEYSKEFYFQAIAINDAIGNKLNQFYAYNDLGNLYAELEINDSTIWAINHAIEYLDTNARPTQYPSSILRLLNAHLHKKEYALSKQYLESGIAYCKSKGLTNSLVDFFRLYGVYYREQNMFKESKDYYLKGLEIIERNKINFQKENYYYSLAYVYGELKDYKSAYEYQTLYAQEKDSNYQTERAQALSEAEVKYGLDKKDLEISLLKKDKVIAKRQKTLLIVLFSIALLLGVIALLSFRQFKLNQKLRIERFRNKIARDLHDDVGSTLSSIAMYSEVIMTKAKDVLPETIPMLQNMTTSSHDLMHAMSDIIWTVNPKHNNLASLLSRIKSFSSELCEAQDINFHYTQKGRIEDLKLNMNVSQNIYLILKEGVNNALKYSQCQNLSLECTYLNKKLTFVLKDDGIGFDTQLKMEGNGMYTMKERMKEINGNLEIQSSNKGTSIRGEYQI